MTAPLHLDTATARPLPLHATPFERKPYVVTEAVWEALIGKRVTERRLDLQLAVQMHEYAEHKREWAAKFGSWCAIDGVSSRERDFNRRMDAELSRLVDEAERQLRGFVPGECERVSAPRITEGMAA